MYTDKQFIFKASWKLSKLYEKSLGGFGEQWGLTQSEMDVLIYLHYNGNQNTSRDIAQHRSISKSLICKSVASLAKKGLLCCTQDRADARMVRLDLTDGGKMQARALADLCEQLCTEVFAGISHEEIVFLQRLIGKLQENGKQWVE